MAIASARISIRELCSDQYVCTLMIDNVLTLLNGRCGSKFQIERFEEAREQRQYIINVLLLVDG